jgi:hypothetical protein
MIGSKAKGKGRDGPRAVSCDMGKKDVYEAGRRSVHEPSSVIAL